MKEPVLPPVREKYIADAVVVGGGLIGLSIALELEARGAQVTVMERGRALQQASIAAAGMLAMHDPANPAALLDLARMSAGWYPAFLARLERMGGVAVPFQTETTLQYEGSRVKRLAERSLDPRQLAEAVLQAVRASSIKLLETTEVERVNESADGVRVMARSGVEVKARDVVYAGGAWSEGVQPMKGQMLRMKVPVGVVLQEVHRNEQVYVVPRTMGPQAGTALVGATVEDVGFDTTVDAESLARLRRLAAEIAPDLAWAVEAPLVEAWAGLRPATRDELPVIGAVGAHRYVASGHYRNGVLLAPGTARAMADLLMRKTPDVDVGAFGPERFGW